MSISRFACAAVLAATPLFNHGTAQAVSLTHDGFVEISQGSDAGLNFDISVFAGQAGFVGGTNSGTFGDGTVLDYRFFNSSGTTFNTTGYANGGGGIVGTAAATNTSNGNLNWADVWTTGDINSDPADFTTQTMARSQGVSGTLDVSGSVSIGQLESGTLDFIHGTFVNSWTIALTMTGPGQPDVMASFTSGTFSSTNRAFNSTFSFSDATAYDTISYTYTNTDTDGSRARFMGVVVDGVGVVIPEPATATLGLLALGGLGAMTRRRRA